MNSDDLQVGSVWSKRVAPAAFELRRIEGIAGHKVIASSHVGPTKEFYDYEFEDLFAPLTKNSSEVSLAGSGHRPEHIIRGKKTLEEVRWQLYRFYVNLLKWLRPREVISGLARGLDLWFAWAAIEADVPVIGAVPHPNQARGWSEEDAREWALAVDACAEVYTVSAHFWEKDGDNALHARNRWMVDRCTWLTTFWQGTRGGTANANDYAIRVRKPRLVINTLEGW